MGCLCVCACVFPQLHARETQLIEHANTHARAHTHTHTCTNMYTPLRGSCSDANQHTPLEVGSCAVADDLGTRQVGRALKHFDGGGIRRTLRGATEQGAVLFDMSLQSW